MVTCQSANQLKTPAKVSWAFKMVSQFGSLGYTIMGKTIIDTLHKEGKTQTFIAKEAGCSQSAVSKHVNRKLSGRKKCGRKRCTTNRENRSLMRIVKQNQFKNLGELHKEWTENESHIHIKTLVWMSDRIILSFHLLRVIPDDSAAQYSCLLHTSWFWKKKNVLVRNCTLVFFSLKFPLVMRNMTSGVIHDTNGEAVGGALLSL